MNALRPVSSALTVAGYRIGWRAVRLLPAPISYGLFQAMADAAVARNGKGVQRLRANYARVRPELAAPELDQLVRAGMRSYLRYFCDAFRLPDVSSEELGRAIVATHDEPVRAALAAGRGVVIFVGHMGNFDAAGAWATTHLAPVTTVAERLEPEQVFEDFLAYRTGLGMTITPLTGGGNPYRAMLTALHRGALVALPADRDLTRHGVEVELCGHPARVAKGPATLARSTGAALFAAAVWYEDAPGGGGMAGRTIRVDFSAPIRTDDLPPEQDPVVALTQRCVDFLGAGIRAHTSAWHMLQRVFVEDLDDRHTASAEPA